MTRFWNNLYRVRRVSGITCIGYYHSQKIGIRNDLFGSKLTKWSEPDIQKQLRLSRERFVLVLIYYIM